MLGALFTPDLSPAYLADLAGPVAETLALTLAAVSVAVVAGTMLALVSALDGWPGRTLASLATAFRAVPDLTLAVLCVVLFGLGSGAALVALALYYTATAAKAFAGLLAAVPRAPVRGLAGAGAGGAVQALWGLLPLAAPQMIAYGPFVFECAFRAAVVVGAVGGGGIGAELVGSLAAFDLPRASTCIIVTVALALLLERAALFVRMHPPVIAPLLALGLVLALVWWPPVLPGHYGARVLSGLVSPHLPAEQWQALPRLLLETFAMAAAATLLAASLALPLALACGRTASAPLLGRSVRVAAAVLRAMPEAVWALVLMLWLGIGPAVGAAALFLHSLGALVRLFADTIDATEPTARRAVLRTGAGQTTAAIYGALPPAAGALATHVAFRFDWNLRMATVLGLIGAGGIGQELYEAQQLMHYGELSAWLLVTAAMLIGTERALAALAGAWRKRVGVEPTRGWLTAPPGFEVRTCHRARFSSIQAAAAPVVLSR